MCAVCGEPLPERARFCANCGAPVETSLGTDERKMVTVVFADMVDSTGLAQRLDPERAREVLGQFFDAASEELLALRGRPEKFIGDAVMAVFGLPTVHEDDALRAVRASLAIRGRMGRLSESLELPQPIDVHVGIESGEVAMGIGPAGQLLVTGPVVNAAGLAGRSRPRDSRRTWPGSRSKGSPCARDAERSRSSGGAASSRSCARRSRAFRAPAARRW